MLSVDLAQRAYNHGHRIDPIVRSLLDTDFYKLLMAQFVWAKYPHARVTFAMKNRSKTVRIADTVPEEELRAQLDHARGLRFSESELIWLAGNTFYGQRGIFQPGFVDALRALRLPEYRLERRASGEYDLSFEGSWLETTFWEIPALAIASELRSRAAMRGMSRYELKVLYANATTRIVADVKALREAGVPRISEFGTRRRHSFLWQTFVLEAMQEELGDAFLGTSNAYHAQRLSLPAIGTNAHELPMTLAALAVANGGDDEALRDSQYRVLREWSEVFGGHLLVGLPDTFGTTQFLRGAAESVPGIAAWRGFREDSKNPFVAAEEKIAFWRSVGADPKTKLQLFSDGLDVPKMIALHRAFGDRIQDGYGWGTLATNNFRGCDPRGGGAFDPISLVCKVESASDVSTGKAAHAVKMSDNYEKAVGPLHDLARYRRVFGTEGLSNVPVVV